MLRCHLSILSETFASFVSALPLGNCEDTRKEEAASLHSYLRGGLTQLGLAGEKSGESVLFLYSTVV